MFAPLGSVHCALALQRLGFELETVDERRMILRRAGRRVFLPRHRILMPGELRAVLQLARVTEHEFAGVLPPGATSGVFSRPDDAAVSAAAAGRKK